MKSTSKSIWLALIIVVVVVGLVAWSWLTDEAAQRAPEDSEMETSEMMEETASMEESGVYEWASYGLSFELPEGWNALELTEGGTLYITQADSVPEDLAGTTRWTQFNAYPKATTGFTLDSRLEFWSYFEGYASEPMAEEPQFYTVTTYSASEDLNYTHYIMEDAETIYELSFPEGDPEEEALVKEILDRNFRS